MQNTQRDKTVWMVSELYYPEATSTGYIVTEIAEHLAKDYSVQAVCSQPTYSARGVKAPRRELRNGVRIWRCWSTTFNKDRLVLRLINILTICSTFFLKLLVSLRRGDQVIVLSNPPFLPFLVVFACRLHGAKCVLIVHDIYPETAIAPGLLRSGSLVSRVWDRATRWLFRSVDQLVVLGRDMEELVRRKLDGRPQRVEVIPNWADIEGVYPTPRSENRLLETTGLQGKFVVQLAGNLGKLQDIEMILEAAKCLRGEEDIHFLLIGSGSKKDWLARQIQELGLMNMTVLGHRPRHESVEFLNACDVALSALIFGLWGVSVPSRLYNIFATGKPIIAVSEPGSESARVVEEARVGWFVPCRDVAGLVAAIREARSDPARLVEMGRRARTLAETTYRKDLILDAYAALVRELFGASLPPASAPGAGETVSPPGALEGVPGSVEGSRSS